MLNVDIGIAHWGQYFGFPKNVQANEVCYELGDAKAHGKISTGDAVMVLKHMASSITLTENTAKAGEL